MAALQPARNRCRGAVETVPVKRSVRVIPVVRRQGVGCGVILCAGNRFDGGRPAAEGVMPCVIVGSYGSRPVINGRAEMLYV